VRIVEIRIRLGTGIARIAPAPMLSLELPEGATVDDLYDRLTASHPELAPALVSTLPAGSGCARFQMRRSDGDVEKLTVAPTQSAKGRTRSAEPRGGTT
jgi:uncharacterized iron-regulated membrane protein